MAVPPEVPPSGVVPGQPRGRPTTVVVVLVCPGRRGAVPELCRELRALLTGHPAQLVVCDVGRVAAANLTTVDALARLQLTATLLGRPFRVRAASPELRRLLGLLGLDGVLRCADTAVEGPAAEGAVP